MMCRRQSNWEARLSAFIERQRDVPFAWGSNDCVSLIDGAVLAQTGDSLLAAYGGRKNVEKTARGVVGFFDRTFERSNRTGQIPRGWIVARRNRDPDAVLGLCLGVSVGSLVAFIGEAGVEFQELDAGDLSWIIA